MTLLMGFLGAVSLEAVETYSKLVSPTPNTRFRGIVSLAAAETDEEGATYVTAAVRGGVEFSSGVVIPPKLPATPDVEPADVILGRLDSNGGWAWAKRILIPLTIRGSDGIDYTTRTTSRDFVEIKDLSVGPTNIVVAGVFRPTSGSRVGFVTKLNKSGDVLWTKFLVSDANCALNAVTEDTLGNLYLGGQVTGKGAIVGTVNGVFRRDLVGDGVSSDMQALVARYQGDGVLNWAQTTSSGSGDSEETVALEMDGNGVLHVLMNLRGATFGFRNPNGTTAQTINRGIYRAGPFIGKIGAGGTWSSGRLLGGTSEIGLISSAQAGSAEVFGTDLKIVAGKVFVSGRFTVDGVHRDRGFVTRLQLDTHASDGTSAYLMTGTGVGFPSYPTRLRSAGRNLLLVGEMPTTLRIHGAISPGATSVGTTFTELTSLRPGKFIGSLDTQLNVRWFRTASRADSVQSPRTWTGDVLAFDSATGRVYWGGGLRTDGTEKLWLGDVPSETALALVEPPPPILAAEMAGWLTAFDEEGRPIRQVRLTVSSDYTPILVNEVPYATTRYQETYLEGTTVRIRANDQELDGIRRVVRGHTVDNQIGTTESRSLSATLFNDMTVQYLWDTQYRLRIESDHVQVGLISMATAGNPVPLYGDLWVRAGSLVDATVDGYVVPVDAAEWGSRYVVQSYTFSNAVTKVTTPISQVVDRVQVEPLKSMPMESPASILYSWKKQHRLNVQVGDPAAESLVFATQTSGTPARFVGAGEMWFDDKARVEVFARATDSAGTLTLLGWDFASPVPEFFPATPFVADQPPYDVPAFLTAGNVLTRTDLPTGGIHYMRAIPTFSQQASILWRYGDPVITTNVAVGVGFKLPVLASKGAAPTTGWDRIRVLEGPPGSDGDSMMIWDPKNQIAIPTRPGIFLVDFLYGAQRANRVVIQIYSGFSGDLWQNDATKTQRYVNPAGFQTHVAGTPPVVLDRFDRDKQFFKEFRFSTSDGAVEAGKFTASTPGRSVLVFTRLPEVVSGIATGDLTRENLSVVVVNTVLWSSVLETSSTAVTIGAPLSSTRDTAGLGTGYVVHKVANYNPDLYNRETLQGPIIPVNARNGTADVNSDRELVVVWYQDQGSVQWPYRSVFYPSFVWPAANTGNRIVIASRLGSEGANFGLNRQLRFDPELYDEVRIYNQPDRDKAGYNPNEEHARIYPSLHASLIGKTIPAAFAFRDDLNITTPLIAASRGGLKATDYTSDPFVLVQYRIKDSNVRTMAIYAVQREDPSTSDPWVAELPGAIGPRYTFTYGLQAGERVSAPYPLNLTLGLEPCLNTVANPFANASAVPDGTYYLDVPGQPRAWFLDHKQSTWAVAGNSAIRAFYSYPLADDFWYPFALDGAANTARQTGDCVPWLPKLNPTGGQLGVFDSDAADFRVRTEPVEVNYATRWPENSPVLKVGETLTFAGGEYKADRPDAPGLPGVLGFAAGQIVFDSKNPLMSTLVSDPNGYSGSFSARIIEPLTERAIGVPVGDLPPNVREPASPDITVNGDTWTFNKLSPSLRKRLVYRPFAKLTSGGANGVLVLRGFVNDLTLGDNELTASPPPLYVVEPNVLNERDREELRDPNVFGLWSPWLGHVERLYALCRNPQSVDTPAGGNGWNVGLEREDASSGARARPLQALGPGLALVTNPRLLDPAFGSGVSYVTVAENNHPSLGDAPITMHVIRIDPAERYRGGIKAILPDNVFDEKITLHHTADFGGNVSDVAFSWYYREEDGKGKVGDVPPGQAGSTPLWNALGSSAGQVGQAQVELNGDPRLLLADNLFFARYRRAGPSFQEKDWSQWAGAANSSIQDLDNDGRPDLRPQLAMGWVKRVLDAVNPYEARIREFGKNGSPATASSMIRQLGAPYVGPVALNASKDVVENLGLIELYETVLNRARDMTINGSSGLSSSGIDAAILLASTRLAEFYTLLGNEAWTDALDPTLAFGNDATAAGSLDTTRFCFENQVPNLLAEELALLRGVDESYGRPVFNRLFWNFTKGQGEVAYAVNYQLADVNQDGFIDENDALKQYPMGHGDAWGHYLSAMRKRYDLLRNPVFDWESRGEYYNLLDVVIGVDYQDERSFAKTAAARARVGNEIVQLTFRSRYSEAPDSKLSGYTDPDRDRAWGVTEWARRVGQAAYFDWVTGNALLPFVYPDPTIDSTKRLDRESVNEWSEVAALLTEVQVTLDRANSGLNAIGLDPDVLPFDMDPTHIDVGSTAQIGNQAVQGLSHYEQIAERAFEAMRNASVALKSASELKARNREVEQSAETLRRSAIAQDIEYRNRLIEIFGTPYEGQIGAGKAYPAGYNGPDLNLFMYVDVNAITPGTVPVANSDTYFDEYTSFYDLVVSFNDLDADVPESFKTDIEEHFLDDISFDGNTSVELLGDDLVHLRLPAVAADYTFVAPESWGQRAAPGRLQSLVGEMLQVQAELSLAVGDYDFLIKQLRDRVSLMQMRAEVDAKILGIKNERYDTLIGLNVAINYLQALATSFETTAQYVELIGAATSELPEAVGTANDVTAPARQAVKFAATAGWIGTIISAKSLEATANIMESSKEIIDLRDEIAIDELEMGVELRGMLHEIEEMLVNEGVTRIRLFSIREQLRGLLDQYRATLQEGIRLIDERRNANIQLAAAAQSNRYHDMLFRTSRHEAIQRYRGLFDLAQRYCYLAAKAYAYETNFDDRDRAAAQPLLTEIVRARALGSIGEKQPNTGVGLAGVMARLQDNFRAIEGRLGFNNFQRDTTRFSLRKEWALVNTDADWRNVLENAKRADLWEVPEFRRFCRPFMARTGPQPGIVIRFGSTVTAGTNFFGKMLGAGHSAFDPSLYATKIRAAGIRFDGYPIESLARTPYVYLVPAGVDRMTVPNSPTLETRSWRVMDQAIPVPHASSAADLNREGWLPSLDSLSGTLGEIRRFSSFRAAVDDADPDLNVTRFIGRSVWNDNWVLIIPGQTLHATSDEGVSQFIESVSDIVLSLETYGYSGN